MMLNLNYWGWGVKSKHLPCGGYEDFLDGTNTVYYSTAVGTMAWDGISEKDGHNLTGFSSS